MVPLLWIMIVVHITPALGNYLPFSFGLIHDQASTSASLTILKPLTVYHNKPWKILKEMGIPEHFTCLLRKLHTGQETTYRTGQGTMDWFKIGKGVSQGRIMLPCLFNLCAEYIM